MEPRIGPRAVTVTASEFGTIGNMSGVISIFAGIASRSASPSRSTETRIQRTSLDRQADYSWL